MHIGSLARFVLLTLCFGRIVCWAQEVPTTAANLERIPLAFEKHGERFVARGRGYAVNLESGKAAIRVSSGSSESARGILLSFKDSQVSRAQPGRELPGKVNYFQGNDSREWQTGMPTFERVTFPQTYPGIDLVYYGNQQRLEFDFVVRSGGNPKKIVMKIAGARQLSIDPSGSLRFGDSNQLKMDLPRIYQEIGGKRRAIAGHYRIRHKDEVHFDVDDYDREFPLVIDPTIVYSTVVGGGLGTSYGSGIALDASGNILIAGVTFASDFPISSAFLSQFTGNSSEGFISKINAAGTAFVYSTYLGGSSDQGLSGIAVDASGSAWVTGYTDSSNFPILNSAQATPLGYPDGVISRLSPTGTLQFSTYIGSGSGAKCNAIAVDSLGNGYITGAGHQGFPTTAGVLQSSGAGQSDAFVRKYSPTGKLLYSTLLGGESDDYSYGIAVDSGGNAYITGSTSSPTFTGAPGGGAQTANSGSNAFVAKLSADASRLLYFTFLGGAGSDTGNSIAVDASGNTYIGGYTTSSGLATAGAFQTAFSGGTDGFVARLNANGTAFTYYTYLGGNRRTVVQGLAPDAVGNVYLTGFTNATDFPTVAAVQPALPGNVTSVFSSTDSGNTWTAYDTNIPGSVFDISLNPAGSTGVVLTDNGIYKTLDGGTSWTRQSSVAGNNAASYLARSTVASGTIYAAVNSGSIYQSTNDGATWSLKGQAPSQKGLLADPLSETTLYLYSPTAPFVYVSKDSGSTWAAAAGGLPGVSINAMVATTNGNIFAGTASSGIYRSTNQGASWTAVNNGIQAFSLVRYPHSLAANGNVAYFVNGLPEETQNGGASWFSPSSGGSVGYQVATSPQSPAVVYLLNLNSTVQKSSNFGGTWSSAGGVLPLGVSYANSILSVDPVNSSHVLLISTVPTAAFAAKLNTNGSALLWSTYLGGTSLSVGSSVAADGAGNAYVTGKTEGSAGFPLTANTLPSGAAGALLTKISDATASCSVSMTPRTQTVTSSGQALSFSVVSPSGCTWTATTDQTWATVISGQSGSGSGVVIVNVAGASTFASRTANLTVGTQNVIILQEGSCGLSLDKPSYSVPASGGTVVVNLNVGLVSCPWVVTNNYPGAISIDAGATGTGSAPISITVAPNSSATPRTFSLPIGAYLGPTIKILQATAAVSVATVGLPSATLGEIYSVPLSANGGIAPYSKWTIASGSLPPGLSLDASTGIISGTPTALDGSPYLLGVTVTDSGSTVSVAQTLSIFVQVPTLFAGQSEVSTASRVNPSQSLLFPFVTSLPNYDTEISVSNTSKDTESSTPATGTCTFNLYGSGGSSSGSITTPPIIPGTVYRFLLSDAVPYFQGYVIATCGFSLVRGEARQFSSTESYRQAAQPIRLPRTLPPTSSLLIPFVNSNAGFDTTIRIANTNSDPFGTTAEFDTCILYFYGTNTISPYATSSITAGAVYTVALSTIATGFQGYVIGQCTIGGLTATAQITNHNGVSYTVTGEQIDLPRAAGPQTLLFQAVTNAPGYDTTIVVANTSKDPFGVAGATPQTGNCSVNFYGTSAPPPFNIYVGGGAFYSTALSAIAPGFQGYITAACAFPFARGIALVKSSSMNSSYSVAAELVTTPRNSMNSSLLFANLTNVTSGTLSNNTNITISNTSNDSFGTVAASGACVISYFGTMLGGGSPPSPQTSVGIPAGGQLRFSLSQGNSAQGIAGAPGFQGYIISDCGFPLARGVAQITGVPLVIKQPSTVSLAASQNPVSFGAPVSMIANVSPAGATGMVTFLQGTTVLGSVQLNQGTAQFDVTSTLAASANQFQAVYSGDITYSASVSAIFAETVNKVNAKLTFLTSPNPADSNSPIHLSVLLAPERATGTIIIKDGSTLIDEVYLGTGESFSDVYLFSPGVHTITANYSGDASVYPITATVMHTIYATRASSALTLVSSANPAVFSAGLTFTASLASSAATGSTATGSVTFYDGLSVLGTRVVASGQASFTTKFLPSGSRSIHAYYSGDTLNTPATSTLLTQVVKPSVSTGFSAMRDSAAGTAPKALAVGDFNGDGILDLAVVNATTNGLSILMGVGNASFQPPVTYATGTNSSSLVICDFDGDGKQDIAVGNVGGSSVSVFLGNGDGTVRTAVNFPTSGGPQAIVATDFNRDGRVDIATANQDGNISILLGNGDGTFQERLDFPSGQSTISSPVSLAVGDFSPDGEPGLAVSFGGGPLRLYGGTGTGFFTEFFDLSLINPPATIAVADFNGDGLTDAAFPGGGGVQISRGAYSPSLGTPKTYFTGVPADTGNIAVGDLNGDGKTDLVVSTPNGLYVFSGNGDLTFQPGVNYGGSANFGQVTIGDFNGDGIADIATLVGNSLAVLLGIAPNSPPTVVSATPSSGTGGAQTFSAVFTDPDGATDIQFAQMVIGVAANGGGQKSCLVHYDRVGNTLYLYGDGGYFLGPVALGASSNLLQTSSCSVSALNSSATFVGDTLTLNIAVSFEPAFSGLKNVYLRAYDSARHDSGTVQSGTWTAPATHAASGFTMAPASGAGSGGVFTATFPDAAIFTGANPAWAQVLFAANPSGATDFCLVHYDAGGNGLWLYGDNNYFVGPITPGADSGILQNRSCVLNPSGTTVTHVGGSLQLKLAVGFKPGLAGTQNVYLHSLDATGYDSGFQAAGTWTVTNAPAAISLNLTSTSGTSQKLSGTFYHPSGAAALQWTQMLIATATNGGGQLFCYAHYDPAGNGMWIYDDLLNYFLGPITPGTSSPLLQTTGCSIDTANSSAGLSLSNYFLNWSVQFKAKSGFSGARNVYLRTEDIFLQDTGFLQLGTITTP